MSQEYRCKIPWQNISKSNPTTHKNDGFQSSGVYLENK
jgi:hypothetical protein